MKISITNYPLYKFPVLRKKKFNGGPYIFLRRLTDQFEKSPDINLQYFKTYSNLHLALGGKDLGKLDKCILRLDGMNIDIKDKNRKNQHKIFIDNILNSKAIVFNSKFCKDVWMKANDIKFPTNTIISNGVPLDQFSKNGHNMRDSLGFTKNDFIIVSSARWRRHKRLKELIEFFKIIKTKNNSYNFKLLILGNTINFENNIDTKDIYFAGDIDSRDLSSWFRTADLYINMAWLEPSGNTHLEAIASGVPVLTVNNGGLKETVIATNSGIISHSDKIYNYDLIDYYNPPKPDYEILYNDFEKILSKLNEIKENINLEPIDIKTISNQYKTFFQYVLK